MIQINLKKEDTASSKLTEIKISKNNYQTKKNQK